MDRNRLPGWANKVIDSIADAPMSPLGRLAARRLGRPEPRGSVGVTEFDLRVPTRLLIAPVNYAAQGRAWAESLERASGCISARNMAVTMPGGFAFESDLLVPTGTYHNDADWQRRQFDAVAENATHVLIEAEEPPFGRLMGRSVERQAEALLDRGVDVAYLAHGTDARLPSRHRELSEWSYYRDESVYLPRLEDVAARNIELLQSSARKLFVSTPDLLLDVPQAAWCPVSVDTARWAAPARPPRDHSAPLRVVHAPSNPVLKGTPLIMPTLEKLAAEGVIEFRIIQGVPSAEMPALFAESDVLLDQFRLGSYGVAACESMAAGCAVVGQVSAQVREAVAAASGRELPIVEANPDTLEAVLRELAADPEFDALSRTGLEFVREVHDGRMAAGVLREHWLD
ncbi:hypothetical protein [Leucobacter ruminantium]|uniref:Uncharacterized protein n=1 Tax=Leucobacter ruminantium TaxID=1289170 RepID=A0A939RUB6_9MICO|nr:hypothetical protein [Leucobacter ruminantium]MBO1805535.1 hypothetical protein [Leucobacter ruminantium]